MVLKVNVIIVTDFLFKMGEDSTRGIVVDYLKYRLDSCGYHWDDGRQNDIAPNLYQAAMRRLGDEFEERYSARFNDMIQKLNINDDNASDTFSAIIEEIFSDDVNWGRIVALFGFSGRFVIHCYENNMVHMVDTVVEIVTAYVDNHLREWMEAHNYWQGFIEFQAVEPESRKDIQWPSFKRLWGLAFAGLGVITLGAFLTQKSL